MSDTIKKCPRCSLVPRFIILGVLGLLTSGCPMMMIPMMGGMGGMNDGQHDAQKKKSSPDTPDDATAPKSRRAPSGEASGH